MTVQVYRSSDAGAPTLSGSVGTLLNVLSACLTGSSFNGTGNAYGSKPCAGWTRAFTGSNIAVYRQPVATSNGMYLQVNDSVNDLASRVTAYENMTAINVGTGQFPTSQQRPASTPTDVGVLFVNRTNFFSNTAPSPWFMIATDTLFHLWINTSGSSAAFTSNSTTSIITFGDLVSLQGISTYDTILIAQTNNSLNTSNAWGQHITLGSNSDSHYMARSWSGVGGSVSVGKSMYGFNVSSGSMGFGNIAVPNSTDGKLYVLPTVVHESISSNNVVIRGYIPGAWSFPHPVTTFMNQGDIITNVAGMTEKTFEAHFVYSQSTSSSVLYEISNTW